MDRENNSAQLFKLLGHPARLAILGALRAGEQCVCHLEAMLGYRQAYISQHLMTLREAGLVQDRREGPNVFYRVAEPAVWRVMEAAGAAEMLPASARHDDCPCPKCRDTASEWRG